MMRAWFDRVLWCTAIGTAGSLVGAGVVLPLAAPATAGDAVEHFSIRNGAVEMIVEIPSLGGHAVIFAWQYAPNAPEMAYTYREVLPAWARDVRPRNKLDEVYDEIVVRQSHGLPLPALMSETLTYPTVDCEGGLMVGGSVTQYEGIDVPVILPFIPMWLGVFVNAATWSVFLGVGTWSAGALRRWRRIRRGLCAKCAYPVGASDVCTECGANVSSSMKACGSRGLPSVSLGDSQGPAPPASETSEHPAS